MKERTRIRLRVRVEPGQGLMTEAIPVEPLGANCYKLSFSPGAVEGIAAGDEIELIGEEDGEFRVLARGGNFCVWFFFPEQGMNRGPEAARLRREVVALGGRMDGGGYTSLVFTCPVSAGFDRIADFFDDAVSRVAGSSWMFSNAYDPSTSAPLDWWKA